MAVLLRGYAVLPRPIVEPPQSISQKKPALFRRGFVQDGGFAPPMRAVRVAHGSAKNCAERLSNKFLFINAGGRSVLAGRRRYVRQILFRPANYKFRSIRV